MNIEELAASVVNDIAEDLDKRESRKQLRAVISYLADKLNTMHSEKRMLETRLDFVRCGVEIAYLSLEDEIKKKNHNSHGRTTTSAEKRTQVPAVACRKR